MKWGRRSTLPPEKSAVAQTRNEACLADGTKRAMLKVRNCMPSAEVNNVRGKLGDRTPVKIGNRKIGLLETIETGIEPTDPSDPIW